jgi:hypothetical protein
VTSPTANPMSMEELAAQATAAETLECWSVDGSDFRYQTLGDLLDSNDHLEKGCIVMVGNQVACDPADWVDADDVIENLACRGSDEGGEWADDYPDVSPEAKAELQTYLEAWARKHAPASFYTVTNVREYVLTYEDCPIYDTETGVGP